MPHDLEDQKDSAKDDEDDGGDDGGHNERSPSAVTFVDHGQTEILLLRLTGSQIEVTLVAVSLAVRVAYGLPNGGAYSSTVIEI